MRLGFISDIHAGYHRGTKVDPITEINIREQDVYLAAEEGIRALVEVGVDAIVDLGDMAHTPSPKKRAVRELIRLVQWAGVPYYSANGNHTLQRTASDIHLYDIISEYAPNFRGFKSPAYEADLRGLFIPYGTSDEVRDALRIVSRHSVEFIAGHWACDDVPFPGDHINVSDLPRGIPTFLGHYHTRKMPKVYYFQEPIYIGAIERFAWGEAQNPTGVLIWDTEEKTLEFIDHETRRWVDIVVNPDTYLEDKYYEKVEDAIVRVTVEASAEEYASMDVVALRKKVSPSLEYQVRRHSNALQIESSPVTRGLSVHGAWHEHIKKARLPKGVSRKEVARIGTEALT